MSYNLISKFVNNHYHSILCDSYKLIDKKPRWN